MLFILLFTDIVVLSTLFMSFPFLKILIYLLLIFLTFLLQIFFFIPLSIMCFYFFFLHFFFKYSFFSSKSTCFTSGIQMSKRLLFTWISAISTNFHLRCMRLVEVIISLLVWSCPTESSTDQLGKGVCTGFYLVITTVSRLFLIYPVTLNNRILYQNLLSISGLRTLMVELIDGKEKDAVYIGSRKQFLGRYNTPITHWFQI